MSATLLPANAPPLRRLAPEWLDIWAANLDADDVTLAPFMPARPEAIPPDDPHAARVRALIHRARGGRVGIIL